MQQQQQRRRQLLWTASQPSQGRPGNTNNLPTYLLHINRTKYEEQTIPQQSASQTATTSSSRITLFMNEYMKDVI